MRPTGSLDIRGYIPPYAYTCSPQEPRTKAGIIIITGIHSKCVNFKLNIYSYTEKLLFRDCNTNIVQSGMKRPIDAYSSTLSNKYPS